ncbi:beta-N-acetylhexosaminidase [Asaia krungthepensis]|uniref:beta-N-acetylhexosaminidase n=1 Tax=Asaia krungthepensis NRIC 0535 TaxID=1307925 RepID=A0ABQ0Q6J8_9PROT|nr:beta-N-acetylhexosaminidase [Asaia krungthepensis]GBQ93665.1 beta-N-acetylhexosaminidase [Asaia krungthepensis NRIC 0535]
MFLPKIMVRSSVALVALLAGCAVAPLAQAGALTPAFMPQPAQVLLSGELIPLASLPQVNWQHAPSSLLKKAVSRFEARLAAVGVSSGKGKALPLTIRVGRDPAYLTLDAREGYRLDVSPKGIMLDADGPAGVIYGLATLLQMIDTHGAQPALVQAHIVDAPRFKWRGLMFDVSRHFQSTDTIKRQLDAMELTKLNVMHWHLSDGTGFRVESKRLPRLQELGGHSRYYTQDQVREIIAYAADRGIRIVPEFDVPGHTLSILTAYPDLAAQQPVPTTQDWRQDCDVASSNGETTTHCTKHPNLNTPAMDPTSPKVLAFARILFAEMAGLFPDRYFHTGGDEVVASQWNNNPEIVAYMKAHGFKDAPALQAAFTAEIEKILAADGKIMMGWDEVSEAPIPKNVVVEAWRGSKWVGTATRVGHPVVVSSGYYLDLLNPSTQHYAVDPFDTRADGLAPNPPGRKPRPLDDAFTLDPNAPPLDEAQKKLVLGGEAPLWTEVVSDEMVDSRLWPRSAALAERYWSAQSVTDPVSLAHRLPVVTNTLEAYGLRASDHQARMIASLTPENITPLTQLVAVTVPVRNYAINRLAGQKGDIILTSPAAIASPDSFEANEFNEMAARYAGGDRGTAPVLQEKLARYAGNDHAFQQLAGHPEIDEVKPISAQLAALSMLGLEALQTAQRDRAWHDHASQLLAEQDAAWSASADHEASNHTAQPAGGLLIAIVPGIKALVSTVH